MLIRRGYVYRLSPTPDQASAFRRWIGTCRAVYNAALNQRSDFWRAYQRAEGWSISFESQGRELTALRAEFDWIAACPQVAEQQALRDLDKAFASFFAGLAHYPTPRKKHFNDSMRFPAKEFTVERLKRRNARIKIPKLGWVRFRLSRPIEGEIVNATISHDALGWSVAFSTHVETITVPAPDDTVGIDRGIANSAALSTGEILPFPREALRAADDRRKAHQKRASGRKRGSKRQRKATNLAARQSARAARIRKHANQMATTLLARRYRVIVLEDLKVLNMTASARGTAATPGKKVRQKAGLNRSILETGWSQFETLLTYKVAQRGGEIRLVDPRNTSRRCPHCGHVDAANRKTQALFQCVECGHVAHADINAAVNILKAGTRPSRSSKERQSRESREAT